MDNNAVWKPLLPFGIDNGELDGLSAQDIFTRGFEMGRTYGISETLDHGDCASFLIHSDNEERSRKAAELHKCRLETTFENDDWMRAAVFRR